MMQVVLAVYRITISIHGGSNSGTAAAQFVRIKGTDGETEEMPCLANFNMIGQDVTCTVSSSQNIGTYRCIIWRTTTTDGWNFEQVIGLDERYDHFNLYIIWV